MVARIQPSMIINVRYYRTESDKRNSEEWLSGKRLGYLDCEDWYLGCEELIQHDRNLRRVYAIII